MFKFFKLIPVLLVFHSIGQTLEWKKVEPPGFLNEILEQQGYTNKSGQISLNSDKAILVFKSIEDINFDSSYDNLIQPKKIKSAFLSNDEFFYILLINPIPQKLILTSATDECKISFQQANEEKESLPGLNANEVYYFELSSRLMLEYFNITESEKAKGNIGQAVGPNVSDALIIIKTFPTDLDIQISADGAIITKYQKTDKGQSVFIKTKTNATTDIVLNVQNPEFGATPIRLYDIKSKELRYYLIKKPQDQIENSNIVPIASNDKLNILEGNWSGDFKNDILHLLINEMDLKSNKLKGSIIKDGLNYSFIGNILIDKTVNKTYILKIKTNEKELVGTMKNFNVDFHYNGKTLSGYIIDNKNIGYETILKKNKESVNVNTVNNLINYKQKYNNLLGSYSIQKIENLGNVQPAQPNVNVSQIIVNSLDETNNVLGLVFFDNNEPCFFTANLNENDLGYSFRLDINQLCRYDSWSEELAVNIQNNGLPELTYKDIYIPNSLTRTEMAFTPKINIKYGQIMPSKFQYFAKYLQNETESLIKANEFGDLKLNYNLSFNKRGVKTLSFTNSSTNLNVTFLEKYFSELYLPPPIWDGFNFETIDQDSSNIVWKTVQKKINHTTVSNDYSYKFTELNLPYGNYKIDSKEILIDENLYLEQKLVNYKANGPIYALNSLLLPGWGTRKVTYGQRNGWGKFVAVIAPFATSLTTELISRVNYNKYRNTDNVIDPLIANDYLTNANKFRRISLITFGLGATAYLFEFSWVINKGIKNRSQVISVNEKIKTNTPIFLRKDTIKL
jgi:hypothetical protein